MTETKRPGLVYHEDYLLHTAERHPERKDRLEAAIAALKKEGLLERLNRIEARSATTEELALVHDEDYIAAIEEACLAGQKFLDMDTYIGPHSYRVALLSAGGVLAGLEALMAGETGPVFALNRPPGHHAERDRAMGFCLFNNVAVAAAVARQKFGVDRVAIVDWDVHHGNGTQHSFEDDPGVLFISTHQSPAYPGTGGLQEVGREEGRGYTVNIPLPPGCGDADYELFFKSVIVPVLDQYRPGLLLVSAGQDALADDPLAGMNLSTTAYQAMARHLKAAAQRHAGGRMLFCLEGGYHLQAQASAIVQVFRALEENESPPAEVPSPLELSYAAQQRLEEVLAVQRRYWSL